MSKLLIRSAAVGMLASAVLTVSGCTTYSNPSDSERATVAAYGEGNPAPEYRSVYVPLPEGGSVLCIERTVKGESSPAISCDWSRLRP